VRRIAGASFLAIQAHLIPTLSPLKGGAAELAAS
jgi:hypothetical protein